MSIAYFVSLARIQANEGKGFTGFVIWSSSIYISAWNIESVELNISLINFNFILLFYLVYFHEKNQL